jgi:hypothetical protein
MLQNQLVKWDKFLMSNDGFADSETITKLRTDEIYSLAFAVLGSRDTANRCVQVGGTVETIDVNRDIPQQCPYLFHLSSGIRHHGNGSSIRGVINTKARGRIAGSSFFKREVVGEGSHFIIPYIGDIEDIGF